MAREADFSKAIVDAQTLSEAVGRPKDTATDRLFTPAGMALTGDSPRLVYKALSRPMSKSGQNSVRPGRFA